MTDSLPRQPDTLEPALTRFDRRVLAALDPEPDLRLRGNDRPRQQLRDAWDIARSLGTDDVGDVRRVLRGLSHLGYAWSVGWGAKQRWGQSWRATEEPKGSDS